MKSLIVEDDAVSQKVLQAIVTELGEVACAADSNQGFELYASALREGKAFDVIFLDINLPGLDGIELLDEIRRVENEQGIAEPNCVKVIMTTGAADPDNFYDATAAGCTSYFSKPIDRKKLLAELHRLQLC